MINKHKSYIGITLFKWNKLKVELWFSLFGEAIERHTHNEFDGRVMFLFGAVRLCGVCPEEGGITKTREQHFKWFNIHKGDVHWVELLKPRTFVCFLNVENWVKTPSSASIDFVKV